MKSLSQIVLAALAMLAIWIGLRSLNQPPAREIQFALATAQIAESPAPVPTETLQPTATIGYEATSVSAMQTALVAQAIANSAISTSNALEQEHIEATVQSNLLTAQADKWTAEAPPTPTPNVAATNTQAAVNMLALNIRSGELTSTAAAPTVMAQMIRARQDAVIYPVGMAVVMFFVICFGIFLLRITRENKPMAAIPASSPEKEAERHFGTVVTIKRNDPVYPSAGRLVVPCTMDQLDALADGLINRGLTLAFQHWTGADKPFTRDISSFPRMRAFLMAQKLALSATQGNLILTDDGRTFFRSWLEHRTLPPRFIVTSDSGQIPGENMHVRAPHDHADGGGALLESLPKGEAIYGR